MRKKGLLTALLLTAAMAFGLVGCGKNTDSKETDTTNTTKATDTASETKETPKELKKLKILVPGVSGSGEGALSEVLSIAYKEKFLEKELNAVGYTAEIIGFSTAGVGVNEALAAGEGDIAVYGDFPAVTYLSNNDDVSIFAVSSSRVQIGVIAKDDIKTVQDLKGKKIATGIGTTCYKYLEDLLKKNGLSYDDVEIVNANFDSVSLYASGQVDAIAYVSSLLYSAKQYGQGNIITSNGKDEELASTFIAVGKNKFLKENPDVVTAVKKAFTAAKEFAAADPSAAYEDFAKDADGTYTADIYKEIYDFDETFSYFEPEVTDEVITSLQGVADYMLANGYIKKEINIKDYVYSTDALNK